MGKNKIILIGVAIVIVAALALYFFVFKGAKNPYGSPYAQATPTPVVTPSPTATGKITCSDVPCIGTSFLACTPAELKVTPQGATSTITISVFGTENGKCHFSIDMSGHGGDCLFAQENLNEKVLNQLFGNEEGQGQIVAESCKAY